MLNGDGSMVEALAGFVHRLQETIFSRRRESDAGRVLAAVIALHQEAQELSSKNIAEKANELDEESPTLNSEKVGWLTRRLGFNKDKGGSSRRRVILWDQERVERLVKQYGLETPISQERTSEPFGPFETASDGAKGFSEPEKPFGEPFEREFVSEAKGSESPKGFVGESENEVSKALGMSIEKAIAVWTSEGKPIIHLGPGENCFGLEKLLSHRDINERHLIAVKKWLEEKAGKHEENANPL